MAPVLITNADDLGASIGVNDGILHCVEAGVITSASLMINMPGADDAVERMAPHRNVSIGIHVNLTNEAGPPIVDFDDPEACRREVEAQLARFVDAVGRDPTHVDAHHNIHRDSRLAPIFRCVAERLRVPLREDGHVHYLSSFYGRWDGVSHPEHLSPDNLVAMVGKLGVTQTVELACHPGWPEASFVSDYHAERSIEVETLCSPGLLDRLMALGFDHGSYHTLEHR